jgi:hypothetical protein
MGMRGDGGEGGLPDDALTDAITARPACRSHFW